MKYKQRKQENYYSEDTEKCKTEISQGRIEEERLKKAGWVTSIWQGGKVLAVLRDRLEN
jgi:hypothetical protein